MFIENEPSIEPTLNELAQNCYDLLGDIIAAHCLSACGNLQDCYPDDVITCYRHRVADYMTQHSSELTTLVNRATKQLNSVEDIL